MEKIPTPVIVGGGALVALIAVKLAASGGGGAGIRTLGPVASPAADQQAIAAEQSKSQGFATLVQAVTSLDMQAAQIAGAISMEHIKSQTLMNINDAQNAAQNQRDKIAADLARTQGANQLAAQRSADKTSFWSGVIQVGAGLLHLFF